MGRALLGPRLIAVSVTHVGGTELGAMLRTLRLTLSSGLTHASRTHLGPRLVAYHSPAVGVPDLRPVLGALGAALELAALLKEQPAMLRGAEPAALTARKRLAAVFAGKLPHAIRAATPVGVIGSPEVSPDVVHRLLIGHQPAGVDHHLDALHGVRVDLTSGEAEHPVAGGFMCRIACRVSRLAVPGAMANAISLDDDRCLVDENIHYVPVNQASLRPEADASQHEGVVQPPFNRRVSSRRAPPLDARLYENSLDRLIDTTVTAPEGDEPFPRKEPLYDFLLVCISQRGCFSAH